MGSDSPDAMTNDLLRSHVTRVGFDLTLGKTHIAALVYLNESIRQKRYIATNVRHLRFPADPQSQLPARSHARAYAHFATGMHGLEDRGLVIHHYRPDKRDTLLKWHFTITKAGKLVIELLKEVGLYQEYADALPRIEAAS